MIAIFKTDDPIEIKRLSKATDLAMFVWSLIRNELKDNNSISHGTIMDLLDSYSIDIDDLVE